MAGKGRKHETVKIWEKYEKKEGGVSRKNRFCPRCGGGNWLSEQGNRLYCGKCGYTSFGEKPAGKPDEAHREEAGKGHGPAAEEGKTESSGEDIKGDAEKAASSDEAETRGSNEEKPSAGEKPETPGKPEA